MWPYAYEYVSVAIVPLCDVYCADETFPEEYVRYVGSHLPPGSLSVVVVSLP